MSAGNDQNLQPTQVTPEKFHDKFDLFGMTDEMRQYFYDDPNAMLQLRNAAREIYDNRRDKDAKPVYFPMRQWLPVSEDGRISVFWSSSMGYYDELTFRKTSDGSNQTYTRRVENKWENLLDGIWIKKSNWPGTHKKGFGHFLLYREPTEGVN